MHLFGWVYLHGYMCRGLLNVSIGVNVVEWFHLKQFVWVCLFGCICFLGAFEGIDVKQLCMNLVGGIYLNWFIYRGLFARVAGNGFGQVDLDVDEWVYLDECIWRHLFGWFVWFI